MTTPPTTPPTAPMTARLILRLRLGTWERLYVLWGWRATALATVLRLLGVLRPTT